MVSAAVLAIQIPGNVTVGGAVIGNNRPQGKSLGRGGKLPNASSAWQKPARNLRKALVNQCFGMAVKNLIPRRVPRAARFVLPSTDKTPPNFGGVRQIVEGNRRCPQPATREGFSLR